jgi:hypothetical protein
MEDQIKRIINQWDPMNLFPYAPSNEYSSEIQELCNFLENSRCYIISHDLGRKILAIFQSAFGEDLFLKSFDQCNEIAVKIIDEITKN